MKTILISGAVGFIGSNYINHFAQQNPDWQIVVIDKLTYAADLTRINPNSKIRLYVYDINDPYIDELYAIYKPDVTLHLAAESFVDKSINSDAEFWSSNVCGTASLLRAYKKHCPESRMIVTETDEVYGSYALGKDINYKTSQNKGYRENQPLTATSPYAASKSGAALVAESYRITYGLKNLISIRPCNVYGPNQKEKLIPTMIKNAQQNLPVGLYGKGEEIREWMHVSDLCKAIDKLVFAEQIKHSVYNISSGQSMRNIDLAKMLLTKMKKPDNLIEFIKDPRGASHDFEYRIDSDRFRREFNWSPIVTLEKGLDYILNAK